MNLRQPSLQVLLNNFDLKKAPSGKRIDSASRWEFLYIIYDSFMVQVWQP